MGGWTGVRESLDELISKLKFSCLYTMLLLYGASCEYPVVCPCLRWFCMQTPFTKKASPTPQRGRLIKSKGARREKTPPSCYHLCLSFPVSWERRETGVRCHSVEPRLSYSAKGPCAISSLALLNALSKVFHTSGGNIRNNSPLTARLTKTSRISFAIVHRRSWLVVAVVDGYIPAKPARTAAGPKQERSTTCRLFKGRGMGRVGLRKVGVEMKDQAVRSSGTANYSN